MAVMTFLQALSTAVREEMRRDRRVFVMGEDISRGVFGLPADMVQEFGPDRVRDTPISECGFMGAAVGAAAVGMRPVVHSSASFVFVAMDQIVNQAAKMRYMFGGQVKLPVVYRLGIGYGVHAAAHHSDRPYSMFVNMPGLKIVLPSAPIDAKGLLKTAIRGDDPVLFFEDSTLRTKRGEVPDEDYTIPFGVADVKRQGKDVTVVALGGMVPLALEAAERMEQRGASLEVVDPRTLVPLDKATILRSVGKTGRLVIVDVAPKACSMASEIAAMVAEEGLWSLKAPIKRVASANVHVPFSPPLEELLYPNVDRIVRAVEATLE